MPSSPKRRRQREELQHVSQTIERRIEFSGPLPPPSLLRQYEENFSGAAERVVAMAEKEQDHRHKIERRALTSDSIIRVLGMVFAFLITLVALGAAAWLATQGYEFLGGILGLGGISLIIARFLRSTSKPADHPSNSN